MFLLIINFNLLRSIYLSPDDKLNTENGGDIY
jgi:hypothetical protein